MVTWYDNFCPDKPFPPHSHHWIEVASVDRGNIFICKYCLNHQWWPSSLSGAVAFSDMIRKFGVDQAYQFMLEDHPRALSVLNKLGTIKSLKESVTDVQDLATIILAITEYD